MSDTIVSDLIRINGSVRELPPLRNSVKDIINKELRQDIFNHGYDLISVKTTASKSNCSLSDTNLACELAIFIILFQILGDGNHKTLIELLEKSIGTNFSPWEYKNIYSLIDDRFNCPIAYKHYHYFSNTSDSLVLG